MEDDELTGPNGGDAPDRRSVLRRGAVLGGGLVWAAPAVQTIAAPAFATGTPRCQPEIEAKYCQIKHSHGDGRYCRKNHCVRYVFAPTQTCCDCVDQLDHLPRPLAILACKFVRRCTLSHAEICD